MNLEITKITKSKDFDGDNIVFRDIELGPKGRKRVSISIKHSNGASIPLIVKTLPCKSMAGPNMFPSYYFPLILHERKGVLYPTEKQELFQHMIETIIHKCKKWILDNKEKIGRPNLGERDLKKFESVLYYERYYCENGNFNIRKNVSPVLLPKLIFHSGTDIVITPFYEVNNICNPESSRKMVDPSE